MRVCAARSGGVTDSFPRRKHFWVTPSLDTVIAAIAGREIGGG